MPDTLEHPSFFSTATHGVVGSRQLFCVQTFDIAQLTTNPVQIVPSSFVAVGGRGPKGDSNESGKTSFLAAVALLLGDPEWRMTGGGPAGAAALLFEPETAGVAAQSYPAALQGYVVGLFADQDDVQRTALTVWCRINASAPYFKVRYDSRVHLVEGETERERYLAADAIWDSLPRASEVGPEHYAERLYGDSPRCLAYVSRRGKRHSEPSLLQMNAGVFTAERIGHDLIRLTGRATAFEAEEAARVRLDKAKQGLADRELADERSWRDEENQLSGVKDRNRSRSLLTQAEEMWRLHFARGYLDALGRHAEYTQARDLAAENLRARELAVTEAEAEIERLSVPEELTRRREALREELDQVKSQMEDAKDTHGDARRTHAAVNDKLRELDQSADGFAGDCVEAITHRVGIAQAELVRAREDVGSSRALRDAAAERLNEAEAGVEGQAGRLTKLLRDHGIPAAPLRDIELSESARAVWEPLLALYTAGVVVSPGHIDAALIAVDQPGAVLISGQDHSELPAGVVSAPAGANDFLNALANRMKTEPEPRRVLDAELGVVVLGGFDTPQTGHEARLLAARLSFETAEEQLRKAETKAALAAGAVTSAEDDLRRAAAAEESIAVREKLRLAETAVLDAGQAIDDLRGPLAAADEAYIDVMADVRSQEQALTNARERLDSRNEQLADASAAFNDAETRLEKLFLTYWERGWGSDADAARQALEAEDRTERTLRTRAAGRLAEALAAIDVGPDGDNAPTPELASLARSRGQLSDDPDGTPSMLEEFGRPLRDFLAIYETDPVIEERVSAVRDARQAELTVARSEYEGLVDALESLQHGIEQRIHQALDSISEAYDTLNRAAGGYGADLQIESRRPDGPLDRWRWFVTPRWKRSPTGRLLPYDNQANTAQEKLATVQLVLAALLAAPNPQGRVLVLDELGDSLGVSHRREVLRAIAATAQEKGVTVLGTCQDSVMTDAIGHCGELLYFERLSHTEAYNCPTRMFGFDENGGRVELTASALRSGRPWL